MKRFMVCAALATACFISPLQAIAASDVCSVEQRENADALLLNIAAHPTSQKPLIKEHLPLGLPVTTGHDSGGQQLLVNKGYVELYDNDLLTSVWAGFHLTKEDVANTKGVKRVNCFRPDPRVKNGPAPIDYDEPVFDRGHIVNDASLKDEFVEELNTYTMANMAPQTCQLNRGIWLTAEGVVRNWAYKYGDIYVITGSIFDRDGDGKRDPDKSAVRMKSRSGSQRVAVPSSFFKLIYRPLSGSKYGAIAFTFDNNHDKHGTKWAESSKYMKSRQLSLSELEKVTGLTFFPANAKIYENVSWDWKKSAINMEYTCH
jgi:endonuclease G, mitochondrial